MSSVYDIDLPAPPEEVTETAKRSKHREVLTPSQFAAGKKRLVDMVERAFQTLEDAMKLADYPTAVKAAQVLLDRAGYGPKSTMDINTTTCDLTEMTREQLADRASQIAGLIRAQIAAHETVQKSVTIN